jgi:diguanylate cyclase
MSRERPIWLAAGAGVALCLGWAAIPQSPLYTGILTSHVMLALASLLKMAFLGTAALSSLAVVRRFEADNPIHSAWRTLGIGLGLTFLGQLALAPLQIMEGRSPFPSIADLFFVAGYPFLIGAIVSFIGAYRSVGIPVGSTAERAAVFAGVAAAAVIVGIPVVPPLLQADSPFLEKLLNLGYPTLDFVLLMPLAVLLRASLRLTGGQVAGVWRALLGGFVLVCVADIAFAYFSSLGQLHLDPFVHASFIMAYASIAAGVRRQLAVLAA